MTTGLSGRPSIGVFLLLALVLSAFCGVGAPPSEEVGRTSAWRYAEPFMWPGLFGGVICAVLGLVIACVPSGARYAAILCVGSSACTVVGVACATAIDVRPFRATMALAFVFIAIPGIGCVQVLREERKRNTPTPSAEHL
jgi:hypothetical protein